MHDAALTERGQALFPLLSRFNNFYLAGGTALALHIGHRRSVDFDLFTPAELPARLLSNVKRIFPESSVLVTYQAPGQLNILIDNVKATFFQYEYPLIDQVVIWEGVALVSIREIATMKAFAIGKRLSYKDYVDWYYLLSEKHVILPDVIELAQQKFGGDFNDRLFLGQLISLEDIEELPIDWLRQPISKQEIKSFLRQTVRDIKLWVCRDRPPLSAMTGAVLFAPFFSKSQTRKSPRFWSNITSKNMQTIIFAII